jgi:hypothetical protein
MTAKQKKKRNGPYWTPTSSQVKRLGNAARVPGTTDHAIVTYFSGPKDSKGALIAPDNALYEASIHPALLRLTEFHIKTTGAYIHLNRTSDEIQQDCIGYLFSKLHKFDSTREAACGYSYFNWVMKMYLYSLFNANTKVNRYVTYGDEAVNDAIDAHNIAGDMVVESNEASQDMLDTLRERLVASGINNPVTKYLMQLDTRELFCVDRSEKGDRYALIRACVAGSGQPEVVVRTTLKRLLTDT